MRITYDIFVLVADQDSEPREYIDLLKSGLKALEGGVFTKAREVYAKELNIVAKAVAPNTAANQRLRRLLLDRATVAEGADKKRFLESHEDWSKTLTRAIYSIKETLKTGRTMTTSSRTASFVERSIALPERTERGL